MKALYLGAVFELLSDALPVFGTVLFHGLLQHLVLQAAGRRLGLARRRVKVEVRMKGEEISRTMPPGRTPIKPTETHLLLRPLHTAVLLNKRAGEKGQAHIGGH